MREVAYLCNDSKFTVFSFNGINIRFLAPYSLEYYTEVKDWDNGYIVVMAKYRHNLFPEEEYIDLIPILKDLYIEPEYFLKQIKGVELKYDRH